jgi:hypothetical protein
MTDSARRIAVLLAAAGILGAGFLVLADGEPLQSRPEDDPFPHEEHRGLFPSCLACHAGVPEGDEDRLYTVTLEQCARCHDGQERERVAWSRPEPAAHNLVFTHPDHSDAVERADGSPLSCSACHGLEPDAPRMAVGGATAESCLDCHTHRAPDHLSAQAECTTCHRRLTEATSLTRNRIASFPRPPDHEEEGFLTGHGPGAASSVETCAVCHARESCARCHLNGDRMESVRALSGDPRVAALVEGREGEWPEPATHGPRWYQTHGSAASRDPGSCASCHARSSCTTCHTGDEAAVNLMPVPGPGDPTGVRTARIRPPDHGADFTLNHGTAAATALPRCESCHREQTCTGCHASTGGAESGDSGADGALAWPPRETEGGYHPPNFILRHGAEAFAARTECAECHSREAFCRSCHEELGMARGGRLGSSSFHDAVPNWLLGHGTAARRNLESCTSCHQQTSCLRCHSARSGWRINPHGPGFDPGRVSDRSAISCAICHRSLPEEPGG